MLLFTTSCQTVTDNKINDEINKASINEVSVNREPSYEDRQTEQSTDTSKTNNSIPENMQNAENLVEQEVPELKDYSKYISEKSNDKSHLIIECDGISKEINGIVANGDYHGSYYMVYVGEKWEDHKVNWDWFFVSEDLDEILWYYLPESEVYTLSEWRNSTHYRQLDK